MPRKNFQSAGSPPHRDRTNATAGQKMAYVMAMARAFRGEPWRCMVVDTTERAAFLTDPEHAQAVQTGEIRPVGFPIEDVYEFDSGLFSQLSRQWEQDRRTDDQLWRSAVPFGTPRAAA